jgi:glycosyltransferase involved in cell wall biosynthesis
MQNKTLHILGTRGVPAAHGGFETFAEYLSLFLVQRGWEVTVYCQQNSEGDIHEDEWNGVRRVHIPVSRQGPLGTILFDWNSIHHAANEATLTLTLGYNTAIFCAWLRLKRVHNLINMDGIEWKRQKWGILAKTWFYLNEWAGCWLGNHLIADHPQIRQHLISRISKTKITMIPYGADCVVDAPDEAIRTLGLQPDKYLTVIARAEPENSLLEVVSAFSRKPRGVQLAVLGNYDVAGNSYQRAVKAAASDEVCFLGAIYDKELVRALRFHCLAYVHGHQVGGTNPSLIEAMGAGNPVLAHANPFNRWVAGSSARYFNDADGFERVLEEVLGSSSTLEHMKQGSLQRFEEAFTWDKVLADYETLLLNWLPKQALNKYHLP